MSLSSKPSPLTKSLAPLDKQVKISEEPLDDSIGRIWILSASAGSGKTTIVRYLLEQQELNLEFSISATSREKRGQEIDGKDYHFISLEDFKKVIIEAKQELN